MTAVGRVASDGQVRFRTGLAVVVALLAAAAGSCVEINGGAVEVPWDEASVVFEQRFLVMFKILAALPTRSGGF